MNSNNSSIYEQVRKIIRKFDTNDPFKIAKESNIKIKYLDNATDLLGMYTVIQRNRFIFLNSNMEEYMMKMVLAHELGHDALHRHLTKNSPFHEYELFNITSQPEYEANIFAAHLLLDDDEVMELANKKYTDVEIAGILNVNINLLIFKMNEMNRYGTNYNLRHAPQGNFFKKINP
ncbi:ImmA/IrrE family metallo-endopeptidase [Tissierella praeacuta]|uniref:ImmA/IrrE family metallo-endopeptidase n=1 Tax=Tissierella praeacuta TaxID=43131 RepID=UPI0028B15931|nr:ImmA/IrrE family metallo-endopeptidase [Tissierella praeacuta]